MSGRPAAATQLPIAYFTELASGAATLRLAAAVVYRGMPSNAVLRGGGGPLGFLRAARHEVWLRLGPHGADVSIAGRPLFGGTLGAAGGMSSVGHISRTAPLASYDSGSRVLHLLGRAVSAPREDTIVALVDAMGTHAKAPRVILREVRTPEVPTPTFDGYEPSPSATVSYMVSGEQPEWEAALRTDLIVRTFLDSRGAK